MLLDYARPSTPQWKRGLAVMTGAAAAVCGAIAICCAIHAIHLVCGLQHASGSFCGTCYEAMVAALGMPLHHTLSLGVFSGGCALVAGIQTIPFANAARDCGGARAA